MALDLQYYEDCLGEEGHGYQSHAIPLREAVEPKHVKRLFDELAPQGKSDVLVGLVLQSAKLMDKLSIQKAETQFQKELVKEQAKELVYLRSILSKTKEYMQGTINELTEALVDSDDRTNKTLDLLDEDFPIIDFSSLANSADVAFENHKINNQFRIS